MADGMDIALASAAPTVPVRSQRVRMNAHPTATGASPGTGACGAGVTSDRPMPELVGWVERSEAHLSRASRGRWASFVSPSYESAEAPARWRTTIPVGATLVVATIWHPRRVPGQPARPSGCKHIPPASGPTPAASSPTRVSGRSHPVRKPIPPPPDPDPPGVHSAAARTPPEVSTPGL